jgi:hypothetical protein
MSFRAVYTCDICRDETPIERLMGCNFSGMKKFKLDAPGTTKGIHICVGCLDQLQEQLVSKRLPTPDNPGAEPK